VKRRVAGMPLVPFVALTVGFVLLLLGSRFLLVLADDERRETLAQIPLTRDALERELSDELRAVVAERMATYDETVKAELQDPFAPVTVSLVENGEVVLPRVPRGDDADVERVMIAIDGGHVAEQYPEANERLALARAAPSSAAARDAWLDHRCHFMLGVAVDLGTTLFAIEQLDKAGRLDPAGARALFRDGVARPDCKVEGLFAQMLASMARLSPRDLVYLVERSAPLASRYLVRVDDVRARVDEADWFANKAVGDIVSLGGDPAESRALIVTDWLRMRESALYASGRITADAQLRADGGLKKPHVAVATRAWDEARELAWRRFVVKAVGIAFVGVLATIVFVLAIVLQRRRTAYIELRGQLLRAVTHELKTPLASISALAQTLELRPDNPRDYPTRIVTTAERMSFLIDNILSFARLEGDAWRPRPERIAVADLARWLAGDPVARAVRPVDLVVSVPADLTLTADPDLVRLMLSNLLDNAAKYATAERVRVTFSAEMHNQVVHLMVRDDGPGLGDRDPARLFDAFTRGDAKEVRGTGLGLSICRWVVALHGGDIRVAQTSTSGTTFVATFPTPRTPMLAPERVQEIV